ncbi:hypothetical protein BofuT4_P138210.1 [Botrytis cinerea T4]|uniref:Uncharacterized protein n=1 Tax=Botryotinia fuckeliana (strain T4) TaxID=999810 RepID=G2YMP9_BOTF4|nr:hypothetical protein BofuT4_P138210.1 [Botrytis cinerea T4]
MLKANIVIAWQTPYWTLSTRQSSSLALRHKYSKKSFECRESGISSQISSQGISGCALSLTRNKVYRDGIDFLSSFVTPHQGFSSILQSLESPTDIFVLSDLGIASVGFSMTMVVFRNAD